MGHCVETCVTWVPAPAHVMCAGHGSLAPFNSFYLISCAEGVEVYGSCSSQPCKREGLLALLGYNDEDAQHIHNPSFSRTCLNMLIFKFVTDLAAT